MISRLLILWALTGGAIATSVMIVFWLRDPIPGAMGRFIGILVSGLVAGVVGGWFVTASDPMPGIFGAATTALIVSGGLGLLGAARGTAAH